MLSSTAFHLNLEIYEAMYQTNINGSFQKRYSIDAPETGNHKITNEISIRNKVMPIFCQKYLTLFLDINKSICESWKIRKVILLICIQHKLRIVLIPLTFLFAEATNPASNFSREPYRAFTSGARTNCHRAMDRHADDRDRIISSKNKVNQKRTSL